MPEEPSSAEELLERLENEGARKLCAAFRRKPLPSRLLRELYSLNDTPIVSQFIASYTLAPSDLLETLFHSTDSPEILTTLANNPRTPGHLLSQLVTHENAAIRAIAAQCQRLTPRDIHQLVSDPQAQVRTAIATHSSLKKEFQGKLATDEETSVRLALIQTPSFDPKIAVAMSDDPSPIVRAELAGNYKTDEFLLMFWADSDNELLQNALFGRKDLPESILQSLLQSPHPSVRKKALECYTPTDAELLMLTESENEEERIWIAKRENLPTALQRLLSKDPSLEVRKTLIQNASLADEIARHFITIGDEQICSQIAQHTSIKIQLLYELAASRIPIVMKTLAYRDDLDENLLNYLLNEDPSNDFIEHLAVQGKPAAQLNRELARKFAEHKMPCYRALAATAHSLHPTILDSLTCDRYDPVRRNVATNPKSFNDTLDRLKADPVEDIADTAKKLLRKRKRAKLEISKFTVPPLNHSPLPPINTNTESPKVRLFAQLKNIFLKDS